MYKKEKIKNFSDLIAWQEAHNLALFVYRNTNSFPKDEIFGLTNQMRRAAVSVTSNIAEGFARNSSKDKSNFYTIARASLAELQSQSVLARDLGYWNKITFIQFAEQSVKVNKLLAGLIKSATNKEK